MMEISTQTKYPDSQYQHHAATAPSAIPVVSTVIQIPDPTTVLTLHDHALRRVRDSLRSTSGIFALPDTACRITDLQRWLQTFHRLHSRMQYFLCRMGLFLSWYGDVESRKVFSILVVTAIRLVKQSQLLWDPSTRRAIFTLQQLEKIEKQPHTSRYLDDFDQRIATVGYWAPELKMFYAPTQQDLDSLGSLVSF